MRALELPDTQSQMKMIQAKNSYHFANHMHRSRLVQKLLPSPDKDVNLRKRISCDLFRIQEIWAYFLGRAETGHYPHQQQSRDQIFSDKNRAPSPVERM